MLKLNIACYGKSKYVSIINLHNKYIDMLDDYMGISYNIHIQTREE